MTTSTQQTQSIPVHHDEHILVVKRTTLFPETAWHGLKPGNMEEYMHLINAHKEFHPRSIMETDAAYKQIIPYLVFAHADTYFLMQRQSKSSEQRLRNKYSFGIGGHIRQEDMETNSIFDWARREFHEEVDYSGDLEITPLGLLNDDSNAVGQVHIGLVLLLHGTNADISVKSELKSGQLLSLNDSESYYADMESWSQIVFDHLKTL